MSDSSEEVSAALRSLVERHGLPDDAGERLRALLAILAVDDRAPTSVREPARALRAHLADSLAALELEPVRAAGTIADLGAGAGFPGVPLAIALPDGFVSLLESQARKCAFMAAMLETLGIENAVVVNLRAEDWSEGCGAQDLVTARALAPQAVVLEYAAPLLRLGGCLVDWRGRRDPEDERSASRAAVQLGLEAVEVRHVQPYRGAREHHLHVFVKRDPTPERFPRRAGMARKRPLG